MRNWVSRQRCRCSVMHYVMTNRHWGYRMYRMYWMYWMYFMYWRWS